MPARCLRNFLLLLSLFLLAACVAGPLLHPDRLNYPPLEFNPPDVDRLTLPNGIRLYLKEDHELPLIQVSAIIGSGSLATDPAKTGFDQLFAGTWRTGGTEVWTPREFEEHVDQLAANLGAQMGPYFTQLDLSLRADNLDEGLQIIGELLRRPVFAADYLELQRLQSMERVRRQNDSPGNIARRLLAASNYPGHPLGQTPTLASLAAVARADLQAFHASYFAPNNLWLAISGDFDRDRLLDLLDRELGDWQPVALAATPIPEVVADPRGSIQYVRRDIPQTTLLVGDLGLTKDHPDQYAARVLNYIFGGGSFNSRMMREIRSDRGLAYSAYSYFQVGRRLPGAFVAGTETKNESAWEALQLIRAIMADLRDRPVSEQELNLAKDSLVNSFVFGFDDTHAVVTQQVRLDFFDFPADYLREYRQRTAAVTAADVQRVANDFIRFDRQKIVLVGDPQPWLDRLTEFDLPVIETPVDSSE
ncbi:MAG: pitrilysin family protein [Desulfuromonadales bacterium]|nr:pitrilysin family protein [Desulfuromonadales bacterium]